MIKSSNLHVFSKPALILFFVLLTGCAPVISKQIREQVNPHITDEAVLKNPERYKGEIVILGGTILESENTEEGTLIMALHRPVTSRGRPRAIDESAGRFIAIADHYLDVALYGSGRSVTIAGEVKEPRILPLGDIKYNYPVIGIKEIYLWPVERRLYDPGPRIHIGFGLGYRF
ncbi:MAG: Slp family lipoprotein [Candidatus Loosdrechtia sp.]|uniref:Slp family lipoprotein n=1 Tax=Candidatus Loosdrechtia sp. TaxID=3101272 RepID=UPI003A70FC5F|nr:MAG: Slp family lipoprotein [Candidatus Jettenia sp. AMX2]